MSHDEEELRKKKKKLDIDSVVTSTSHAGPSQGNQAAYENYLGQIEQARGEHGAAILAREKANDDLNTARGNLRTAELKNASPDELKALQDEVDKQQELFDKAAQHQDSTYDKMLNVNMTGYEAYLNSGNPKADASTQQTASKTSESNNASAPLSYLPSPSESQTPTDEASNDNDTTPKP